MFVTRKEPIREGCPLCQTRAGPQKAGVPTLVPTLLDMPLGHGGRAVAWPPVPSTTATTCGNTKRKTNPFWKAPNAPAPLCIRGWYCRFPSYFVFFCARARSVLATQRNLAERFTVHLVELFDRHWRSQFRTESFDKVGKESLRQFSTHSQNGFGASTKERELTREKDSTGSGSRRRQQRQEKKKEEEEEEKRGACRLL